MKRMRQHLVGVDQGTELLFSDFADNGPMWSGDGPRQARVPVKFSDRFVSPPAVYVSMGMWDTSSDFNQRADLRAEDITRDGFVIVFRTWGDSQVARIRADWMAIGALPDDEQWELY